MLAQCEAIQMLMPILKFKGSTIFRCARTITFNLVILLAAFGSPDSGGEIVYDNTVHSLNYGLPVIGEIGDEISLGGTGRNITDVQFEYYGQWTAQGDEFGQLYFYLNDGEVVDAFGSRAPSRARRQTP